MLKEVRECFQVDVDHYVRVNFSMFIQGIDAIGGVDITLTPAEADYINNDYHVRRGDVKTNLTKGEILSLVLFAPNLIGVDIEQMTIPVEGTYGGMTGMGGRNLYAVDFEANAAMLKEFFYGQQEP